jgi:hypothetical protein
MGLRSLRSSSPREAASVPLVVTHRAEAHMPECSGCAATSRLARYRTTIKGVGRVRMAVAPRSPSARAGTTTSRPKLANDTGPTASNSPGSPGPTTTSCADSASKNDGSADAATRSDTARDRTASAAWRSRSRSCAAAPIRSGTNAGGPGTMAAVMSMVYLSLSDRSQRGRGWTAVLRWTAYRE